MMKKANGTIVLLLGAALMMSGCSFILGKEEMAAQNGPSFRYIETLRNEASLRGDNLRDLAYNTNPATTLQQPNHVFADAFRVYVTDIATQPSATTRARVFVFDRGDRKVTVLNGTSSSEDEIKLLAPSGIAVDGLGTIFVSDSQQGRVFGYNKNGRRLLTIGALGELARPGGLASDPMRNRLYVIDTFAHQVKVFTRPGEALSDFDTSGRPDDGFKFPGDVALDKMGNLYILDTLRRHVRVYDPAGKFLKAFKLSGTMAGNALKPRGIAVDSDGHLYVTDAVSNNILLFDREGAFLLTWGRTGSLAGEFRAPAGIFIDDQDRVYIADQMNGRVQLFQYIK